MPTTRSYQEIFIDRLRRDPEFKKCLLEEAVEGFLSRRQVALRTSSTAQLGSPSWAVIGKSPKSLMRMRSIRHREIINEVQR